VLRLDGKSSSPVLTSASLLLSLKSIFSKGSKKTPKKWKYLVQEMNRNLQNGRLSNISLIYRKSAEDNLLGTKYGGILFLLTN
jgi:hypothetical protein